MISGVERSTRGEVLVERARGRMLRVCYKALTGATNFGFSFMNFGIFYSSSASYLGLCLRCGVVFVLSGISRR